jgi:ADP-ribose pyrophosphatase YjhB (NUDIX family)
MSKINIIFKKNNVTSTKKKRDIHKRKWNGVGGKFKSCGSPEECATCETLEETGLSVNSMSFVAF